MPARLAGTPVRGGDRDGFTVAVTAAGEPILRLPTGTPGFRRRLREWGCVITPGRPRLVHRTLAHGTAFQLKVWQACRRIPVGETATYGVLARTGGCRSAQAVGSARKRRWLQAERDGLAG